MMALLLIMFLLGLSAVRTSAAVSECGKTYAVQSGDNCWAIWTEHGLVDTEFYALNPGMDCDNLQANQVVCIAPNGSGGVASGCGRSYAVQPGDSCWAIWTKLGLTDTEFHALNPGINCNNLQADQALCVAPGCKGNYAVQAGDTCWTIWTQQGLTDTKFYALNPGINCNTLQAGQLVCISGGGTVSSPPPPPATPPPVKNSPPPAKPPPVIIKPPPAKPPPVISSPPPAKPRPALPPPPPVPSPPLSRPPSYSSPPLPPAPAPSPPTPPAPPPPPCRVAECLPGCAAVATIEPLMTCSGLWSLYNISRAAFLTLNRGINCTALQIDSVVCVAGLSPPACKVSHTVQAGESCLAIMKSSGLSWSQLAGANWLLDCSVLAPGQEVCLDPGVACNDTQVIGDGTCRCPGPTTNTTKGNATSCSDILFRTLGLTFETLALLNPSLGCNASTDAVVAAGTPLCILVSSSGVDTRAVDCLLWRAVAAGDTCWSIWTAAGLTQVQLQQMNPRVDCGLLQMGQLLCIQDSVIAPPKPNVLCARRVDVSEVFSDCASLAAKYNVPLASLKQYNPDGLPCGSGAVTTSGAKQMCVDASVVPVDQDPSSALNPTRTKDLGTVANLIADPELLAMVRQLTETPSQQLNDRLGARLALLLARPDSRAVAQAIEDALGRPSTERAVVPFASLASFCASMASKPDGLGPGSEVGIACMCDVSSPKQPLLYCAALLFSGISNNFEPAAGAQAQDVADAKSNAAGGVSNTDPSRMTAPVGGRHLQQSRSTTARSGDYPVLSIARTGGFGGGGSIGARPADMGVRMVDERDGGLRRDWSSGAGGTGLDGLMQQQQQRQLQRALHAVKGGQAVMVGEAFSMVEQTKSGFISTLLKACDNFGDGLSLADTKKNLQEASESRSSLRSAQLTLDGTQNAVNALTSETITCSVEKCVPIVQPPLLNLCLEAGLVLPNIIMAPFKFDTPGDIDITKGFVACGGDSSNPMNCLVSSSQELQARILSMLAEVNVYIQVKVCIAPENNLPKLVKKVLDGFCVDLARAEYFLLKGQFIFTLSAGAMAWGFGFEAKAQVYLQAYHVDILCRSEDFRCQDFCLMQSGQAFGRFSVKIGFGFFGSWDWSADIPNNWKPECPSLATLAWDSVQAALDATDSSQILRSQLPDGSWIPSTIYKWPDFIVALKNMFETGVADSKFWLGDSPDEATYGLVSIAAFMAQSMQETIQYDACDENNWDIPTGYAAANACGQAGQRYQDYTCGAGQEQYQCQIDPNMQIRGVTQAVWWGAPPAFFCAPRSKVPAAPKWNYLAPVCDVNSSSSPDMSLDSYLQYVQQSTKDQDSCRDYAQQKGGHWELCGGSGCPNAVGRTDVEGCCWWGRGVIQTTGPCNFGKLNYFLGARAKREGRAALFPDIDFCTDPEAICTSIAHPELKWVAGLYYYMTEVQPWTPDTQSNVPSGTWGYMAQLRAFVDGGMAGSDNAFIDGVSGIVNRGCPSATACSTGVVDGLEKRRDNFRIVLRAMKLAA